MQNYFNKLNELKNRAYCPYSNFAVACIVIMKNGTEFSGVNVENAAFPSGICAERVALPQVITAGLNAKDIKEIHLYTASEKVGSPCGQCRQFMAEFLESTLPIYIYNKFEFKMKTNIKELLPFSFTNNDM